MSKTHSNIYILYVDTTKLTSSRVYFKRTTVKFPLTPAKIETHNFFALIHIYILERILFCSAEISLKMSHLLFILVVVFCGNIKTF